MRSIGVSFLVLLFWFIGVAQVDARITLRKSIQGDPEFSTNDTSYVSVGRNYRTLRAALSTDLDAASEIDTYNSRQNVATATLLFGCGVAIWPIYDAARCKMDGTDWAMAGVAGGFALFSFCVSVDSRIHLRRAVKGFNQRNPSKTSSPTAILFPKLINHQTAGIGLAIQF